MPAVRRRLVPLRIPAVAVLPILVPGGSAAQVDDEWTFSSSLNAGAMWHDLAGTGTNPFFVLRNDYVVSRLGVAEFSVGYGQPEQQFGRSHFAVLEGQFQVRWPMGNAAPYLGLGGGVVRDQPVDAEDVETKLDATFSAGLGLRAWLDERTQVRTDVRFRGIDPAFTGSSLEWTIGLGFRW